MYGHTGEFGAVTQEESRRIATIGAFSDKLRLFCSDPATGEFDYTVAKALDKALGEVQAAAAASEMCK